MLSWIRDATGEVALNRRGVGDSMLEIPMRRSLESRYPSTKRTYYGGIEMRRAEVVTCLGVVIDASMGERNGIFPLLVV